MGELICRHRGRTSWRRHSDLNVRRMGKVILDAMQARLVLKVCTHSPVYTSLPLAAAAKVTLTSALEIGVLFTVTRRVLRS